MTRGALLLLVAATTPLAAQRAVQPEARLDVVGPRVYSWQPGIGASASLGYYARLGVVVGYATQPDARFIDDRWRTDVIARVLLDPFREQRWALSLGGGLSVRRQTYLAAVLDLEGPEIGGVLPALEVGASGGLRGSIIVRRAVANRR